MALCGNLAAEARMLPFLLGIGLRTFSMDSMEIPAVQRRIEQIDLARAREQAERMLAFGQTGEVDRYLKALDAGG